MNFAAQAHELSRSQHIVGAEYVISAGDARIEASLSAPLRPRGVVVFLHASSAGRFEPQNRFAGQVLDQADLATLQVDLLTPAEEAVWGTEQGTPSANARLVTRSRAVVEWLENEPTTAGLPIGLLASTPETIAAMIVAESTPRIVGLVSRGGCPNRPEELPSNLQTPTLLIVGPSELARAAELASAFFARRFVSP